jgi:hypothetical protein
VHPISAFFLLTRQNKQASAYFHPKTFLGRNGKNPSELEIVSGTLLIRHKDMDAIKREISVLISATVAPVADCALLPFVLRLHSTGHWFFGLSQYNRHAISTIPASAGRYNASDTPAMVQTKGYRHFASINLL